MELRPLFHQYMSLRPDQKHEYANSIRELSGALLRIAFGEKWRFVPFEKDRLQVSKDTSVMESSHRLVRASVTLNCTEGEICQVLSHSSSDTFRMLMKKLIGKDFADAMVESLIVGQSLTKDGLQEMNDPLELDSLYQEAEDYVEEQIKLQNPKKLNLHHLNFLSIAASDFNTDCADSISIRSSESRIERLSYTPEEARVSYVRYLTSSVPDWCPQAKSIFKFPCQQTKGELITIKSCVVDEGSGVKRKKDIRVVDHISRATIEIKGEEEVGFWCMQSIENDTPQEPFAASRMSLKRFGCFWRPISKEELEFVVCGTIQSKLVNIVMPRVFSMIEELQILIENKRITFQKFAPVQNWVKDSERVICQICTKNFHTLRRKHHCRMCGEVICSDCSIVRVIDVPMIGNSKVRLCKTCMTLAKNTPLPENYDPESSSRDLSHFSSKTNSLEKYPSFNRGDKVYDSPVGSVKSDHFLSMRNTSKSADDDTENINSRHSWRSDSDASLSQLPQSLCKMDIEQPHDCSSVDGVQTQLSETSTDSESNGMFDSLCELASQNLDCPIAFVSIMDDEKECIKASIGLDSEDTYSDVVLFAEELMGSHPLVILDAVTNPKVQGLFSSKKNCTLSTRFFAGCPITNLNGTRIGYICVADKKPRNSLGPDVVYAMEKLATLTLTAMEERKPNIFKGKGNNKMSPHDFDTVTRLQSGNSNIRSTEDTLRTLLEQNYETQKQLAFTNNGTLYSNN